MTKERNKIYSPCYKYCKFWRKEITNVIKADRSCRYKSYAAYFLRLLSQTVCDDVDGKKRVTELSGRPQMYMEGRDMPELLGVRNFSDVLNILDILKNKYNAIDYCIKTRLEHNFPVKTVYIYFNIGVTEFLPEGVYGPDNTEQKMNSNAICANAGFFFVNKTELFDTFYNNDDITPQGLGDLYCLFKLNDVFESNSVISSVPDKLNNTHLSVWRVKNSKSKVLPEFSLYVNQEQLAQFLNVTSMTIHRYLKKLKKHKLIKSKYIRTRGTVVSIVSNYSSEQNEEVDINKVCEHIRNFIKKINEYNRMYSIKYSIKKMSIEFLNLKDYAPKKATEILEFSAPHYTDAECLCA